LALNARRGETVAGLPVTVSRRRVNLEPVYLIAPALVVCIGILYPFGLAVFYSFTNYSLTLPIIKVTGLRNYAYIFSNADFWHATAVTLGFAVSAVAIELVLGMVVALLLDRDTPLAKLMRGLIILPLMIAPVLGTLMWKLMMNPSFGVANFLLSPFGLRDYPWGDSPNTALPTAVLIDNGIYTPFIALLLLAGLRSISPSLYEAAQVDGASPWGTFRAVTLPAIAPYLIVCTLFRMVDSLRAFDILFALTKGGPGNTLWNYQITAYYQTITFSNVGLGSAYMVINWAIIYILSQALVSWWNGAKARAAA
jgi:multiple sugar transport system permease protein